MTVSMEISGNSTFYAGLSSIQAGQNRVDQTAGQIANQAVERSVTSQSSDFQAERLRSVDRSQQSDLTRNLVDLQQGKFQVELGANVAKASDEVLGTLIDTYA
jgi:hypothetical protein